MKRIFLASDSKARRKIMRIFGLKFKVLPTRMKEKKQIRGLSYSALVKKNALDKAKQAARSLKNGIIVAADTITVQDGRVFGKPKNMKAAERMLKSLMRSPQWIYSGVAVIDKDKNKTLVACEKTKVYMDKLSDREIRNYFARTSPLDKAGSFDIQGKGAFFIRRIEGCFYNVVGLPLRRLYQMFKKLDVKVLAFLLVSLCPCVLVSFLAGCSPEYNIVTGKEEYYYYSTEKEIEIGRSIARQIEDEFGLVEDPLMQKRVEDIGRKIVEVCDRKDVGYYFKVLDEDEVNAFALPGGFIYVFKGLIDRVSTDDELAGVLAHEVGHIVARHSIKKLQAVMGYSILRILAAQVPQQAGVGSAADLAFTEILLGYGREDELLADQLATRYANLAGYNPRGMINFLEKLQEDNRRKPARPKSYFKTHPYVPDRIRIVKQELGEKIDFTDYINIEETPAE
ncbi:MAG: septum formation protein Maf [Candidatus Omnitrophota bacterium]|nr:MAG: septum formation protein Maf [Candidatus Omnitrophota bacterium]